MSRSPWIDATAAVGIAQLFEQISGLGGVQVYVAKCSSNVYTTLKHAGCVDIISKWNFFFDIKMGWFGENFHKANIFMNPPDAGYDSFAFSVSNRLILVKTLLYFQYKLTNFGKILFLFSYKSIDIDRNT